MSKLFGTGSIFSNYYDELLSEDEMKLVLEFRVFNFLKQKLGECITLQRLAEWQEYSQEICGKDFECKLTVNEYFNSYQIGKVDIMIYKRIRLKAIESTNFRTSI